MKTYLLLIITSGLLATASCADDKDISSSIKYHVDELKKEIDLDRWNISVDDPKIIVESKFDFEYSGYSVSVGSPLPKTKYRFELLFAPDISDEKFVELYNSRLKYLLIMHYGSKTKEETMVARKFLRDNPLPKYIAAGRLGNYSVYLKSSATEVFRIRPIDAHKEVKEVEAIIQYVFWPKGEQ